MISSKKIQPSTNRTKLTRIIISQFLPKVYYTAISREIGCHTKTYNKEHHHSNMVKQLLDNSLNTS
jgi:hypothetical protein